MEAVRANCLRGQLIFLRNAQPDTFLIREPDQLFIFREWIFAKIEKAASFTVKDIDECKEKASQQSADIPF